MASKSVLHARSEANWTWPLISLAEVQGMIVRQLNRTYRFKVDVNCLSRPLTWPCFINLTGLAFMWLDGHTLPFINVESDTCINIYI